MAIDPALMLAQLGQGERLAHEIQIAPALAQAAEHDVAAKRLLEEQLQVQIMEKGDGAGTVRRRAESPADRRQRRDEQRRQRRAAPLLARQTPENPLTGAPPPDSERGEVAGGLLDTGV